MVIGKGMLMVFKDGVLELSMYMVCIERYGLSKLDLVFGKPDVVATLK